MANRRENLKTAVKYYCRASSMNQLCVNWSLTKLPLGRAFLAFSQSSLEKEWRAISRVFRLRLSCSVRDIRPNFTPLGVLGNILQMYMFSKNHQ